MEKYQKLIQKALLGVVKDVLSDTAKDGLKGNSHFYITFDTSTQGVSIPAFLKERYPNEMTIVLQHQFDELKVEEDSFSVLLSFNGKPERLIVPFKALLGFADPSEQFALQFMPALMHDKKEPAVEIKQQHPAEVIDLAAMRAKK